MSASSHTDRVGTLRYTKDGSSVISGGDDGAIVVLDVSSGDIKWRDDSSHTDFVRGLDLLPPAPGYADSSLRFITAGWDGKVVGHKPDLTS